MLTKLHGLCLVCEGLIVRSLDEAQLCLLATTRAVRKRLDLNKPVPREIINECLELAVQAPTGSNSQGWRWVVVDDPEKKKA